jgi:hypothetical protein
MTPTTSSSLPFMAFINVIIKRRSVRFGRLYTHKLFAIQHKRTLGASVQRTDVASA